MQAHTYLLKLYCGRFKSLSIFLTLLAVVCRYSFIFWTYLRHYRHVVAIESLILCIIVSIFKERSLFVAEVGTEFPPTEDKYYGSSSTQPSFMYI